MPARPDPSRPVDRWDVERAAKRAEDLPPIAAHLILNLCTYLDPESTRLPYAYSPSISGICRDTGWSRRTVTRWLAFLEEAGWLARIRPTRRDAQVKHARTAYSLLIPQRLETGSHQARDTARPGLGTAGDQARDSRRPALGPVSPQARDRAAHNQTSPDQPDQPDPVTGFIAVFYAECGHLVPPEIAERIGQEILARPTAKGKDPLRYVRSVLSMDKHPERWLKPQTKEDDPA